MNTLAEMKITQFLEELSSSSPAPGGGSVAALNGTLSAGLSSMVGNLTYNKKEYKKVKEIMIELSDQAQRLKEFFTESIDKDTEAFNKVMEAFSLPKGTDQEKALREKAIMEATKGATLVPFSVLEKTREAAELALTAAEKGNRNSLSDAGVAGLTAATAAEGALYNVMINLDSIDDEEFNKETAKKAIEINNQVQETVTKIKTIVQEKLKIK